MFFSHPFIPFKALIFAQRFVKANFDSGPRQHVVENFPRTLEQLAKIQQFTQNRPTPTDRYFYAEFFRDLHFFTY